uniref:Uncharacterized protein n=1 Tax=Leersia perrieri TaxID=77586 RepID=A0A0D9W682_9ORYZ
MAAFLSSLTRRYIHLKASPLHLLQTHKLRPPQEFCHPPHRRDGDLGRRHCGVGTSANGVMTRQK